MKKPIENPRKDWKFPKGNKPKLTKEDKEWLKADLASKAEKEWTW